VYSKGKATIVNSTQYCNYCRIAEQVKRKAYYWFDECKLNFCLNRKSNLSVCGTLPLSQYTYNPVFYIGDCGVHFSGPWLCLTLSFQLCISFTSLPMMFVLPLHFQERGCLKEVLEDESVVAGNQPLQPYPESRVSVKCGQMNRC